VVQWARIAAIEASRPQKVIDIVNFEFMAQ
jgi:hypothetical protein